MLSIQTNVNSLVAQQNLSVNSAFQSKTIQRLTSGYRINSSADDAAGQAVANKFRTDVAELTQGVNNANDGVSQLLIVDGGLNNISHILDRLKTLATEASSTTFTGDRGTLNTEYQNMLSEINRQATNINLNTGGRSVTQWKVYIGGASSANSNAMVNVDLAGAAVDTTGLKLAGTSVLGGGTGFAGDTVNLGDTMATFDTGAGGNVGESFVISYVDANGTAQQQTVSIQSTANGYSGTAFVQAINSAMANLATPITGITAQIGGDGHLQFVGTGAFVVQHVANNAPGQAAVDAGATQSLTNLSNFNVSAAFHTFDYDAANTTTAQAETVKFTTGGKDYEVTLSADPTSQYNASTIDKAIGVINQQLVGSGVHAIKDAGGNISFQSSSSFTVDEDSFTAGAGGTTPVDAGNLFAANSIGNKSVTAANAETSATGNALTAIDAVTAAIASLGKVQGKVGAGENLLYYAISLAQSQITNFQSAESQIRDTDVAAEAANLSKAQVLQQASLAAMAQANSAPQQVLTLLRG